MRSGRRVVALVALAASLVACAGEPRGPCSQAQPLGTVCGFANPEDVDHAPAARLVVVSQFRMLGRGGSLAALTPGAAEPRLLWPTATAAAAPDPSVGEPGCTPPEADLFHPHGIFVERTSGLLYVVNHGGREAVEVFTLRGTAEEPALVWSGCIPLPPETAGNDVAVSPDGLVVVSNYMKSVDSIWGNVAIGLGWPTGDVMAWRRGSGWSRVPGSEASAANGVALSADGKTVFYAETGGSRLVRMGIDGSARTEVPVPGGPDNLSWTARGTLYLASHTSNLAFLQCLLGAACRSSWVLLEIDPATLRVDEVLSHDGSVVGAVSSAQQVGPLVYLGAVFGDRIGVWRAPEDTTGSIWSSIAGLPAGWSTIAGLPAGRVLAAQASRPRRRDPAVHGAARGNG